MKNYVSASVLSADMLDLGSEVLKLEKSGIDMLHFDVMDGIFVNNITFGLPVLEQVRKASDITLDVHLMIKEPLKYIERFADAGADIISFHLESDSGAAETLKAIRRCGVSPAIAIRPATPAEEVFELLPYLDMVLVMTVEPGFGGQKFMEDCADKLPFIKEHAKTDLILQVDGGINDKTAKICTQKGANSLVAGNYIYNSGDIKNALKSLR